MTLMQYPVEYVNALITTCSILIAISGILIALPNTRQTLHKTMALWLFFSIVAGVGAIIFANWWFAKADDLKIIAAILSEALQLSINLVALFALARSP